MLRLTVTQATTFVLVSPHYPENVGAAARAAKTMGITRLCLVKPGKLAVPEHEMAFKMAVRAWDVLGATRRCASLQEALSCYDLVFCTSGRRGVSGVISPSVAAQRAVEHAARGGSIAVVFGNEKTGLSSDELALGMQPVKIPMAADQPSINLAQATQIIAYEWFLAGLKARESAPSS